MRHQRRPLKYSLLLQLLLIPPLQFQQLLWQHLTLFSFLFLFFLSLFLYYTWATTAIVCWVLSSARWPTPNAVRLNTSFVDTDVGLKLLFCSCAAFTTQAVLTLCTSKKLLHVHKKIKRPAEALTLAPLIQPVGSLTKNEKGEHYFTVPLWWTVTRRTGTFCYLIDLIWFNTTVVNKDSCTHAFVVIVFLM